MAEVLVKLHLEPLAEGGYVATSVDVPGLVVQGRTVAEAVEYAQDAVCKLYESYLEHGDAVPASG
jgi:predicted RNase H-like HicB family nuclease